MKPDVTGIMAINGKRSNIQLECGQKLFGKAGNESTGGIYYDTGDSEELKK